MTKDDIQFVLEVLETSKSEDLARDIARRKAISILKNEQGTKLSEDPFYLGDPPPAHQPRWKKGDLVRLTNGRDAGKTATVEVEDRGGVRLDKQIGGYYAWNEVDLEAVPQSTPDKQ